MANITVDGKDYDLDLLSDEVKAQVASLQYVDAELGRLNATIAVFQTAKIAYLNALKTHLAALGQDTVTMQ